MSYPRTNTTPLTATATNAVASATKATPGLERRWRIKALSASVSAGTAILTVTTNDGSGAKTIWQEAVAVGGPVSPNLGPNGIQCDPNASVTISLSAAGTSNVGACNATLEAEG